MVALLLVSRRPVTRLRYFLHSKNFQSILLIDTQAIYARLRSADLTAHLKRLSAELEDSLDMNAKAHDRIRGMENQLHEHVVKIRELRRDRGSIPSLEADRKNDKSDDGQQRAA